MFTVKSKVIFKGYRMPPTRGVGLLTVGKEYEVIESGCHHNWIKVRNDKGTTGYYAASQFDAAPVAAPAPEPSL